MISSYQEFLNESMDYLKLAKKLANSKTLRQPLNDCLDRKYRHIEIIPTIDAKSYIGVAINDGASISEVYETEDPTIALVAIIMKNINKTDSASIANIIKYEDAYLNYAVFAGKKVMTPEEVIARYNIPGGLEPGEALPFYSKSRSEHF